MGVFLLELLQHVVWIACPLVTYVFVFKGRSKLRDQHGHYTVPDWNFFLKKWWVRWKVWKLKRHHSLALISSVTTFMPREEDEETEAPRKLMNSEEVDSMKFTGTDHKGNAFNLKVTRKQHKQTEVWIHVQLQDGSVYKLAENTNTVTFRNYRASWSGRGLKFQMCEPLRRWRITFNGLLRCMSCQSDESESTQHVRFSFIWTACSDIVNVQRDWSTSMMCDALARERWRSGSWLDMRTQMGDGYDQWGTLQGTWTVVSNESCTVEMYLRGIRQRRYGIEEAVWQHRAVNYVGVATDGTMFSVEARSSQKPGPTHAIFGHVYQPDGCQSSVESCSISLPQLGEHSDCIPQHAVFRFTGGGRTYTASINTLPDRTVKYHGGQPWNYEANLLVFRCMLNTKQAAGTAVFWYRYSGPCPESTLMSLPFLKEPKIESWLSVPLVVDFNDVQCGSSLLVGGKGSSLGLVASLKEHKLCATVPSGFCVTTAALDLQMQEVNQLQEAVKMLKLVSCTDGNVAALQEQCSRTVSLFESTPICEAVSAEVSQHLQHLLNAGSKSQLFAVRSSAVGEDSEDLSAAGQNATLLGVRSELADILEAIQNCWASLYTFHSLQYRRQHGQPVQVGMGVVVQQMVPADTAGVLFTCHPTTGDPRHMLITANFGLGESVVSAQVEPDTIVVTRGSLGQLSVTDRKCGYKTHRVAVSEEGGVKAETLSNEETSRLCLTTDEILKLGQLGLQLEQMFGGPRDVEWAFAQGQIYLLQARPITSLDSWSDFELLHEFDSPIITDTDVLTTANAGEVFPGATTPLSQSTTLRSADLAVRHGLPYRPGYYYPANVVVSSHHALINVLNTMLRSVGREVTLGDRVVDLAIYGHLVTSEHMLTLAAERNGVLNSLGRLRVIFKILKDLLKKGKVIQQAKTLANEFRLAHEYYRSAKALYASISSRLSLLAQVAECHGDTSRISVFTQVIAMSVLTEGSQELTADHYSDMTLLLRSCSDIISAEIPTALENLAFSITASGRGSEFCKVASSQAVQWLENNCPEAAAKLHSFLDRHGHRSIKEFELMSETWGMQPENLMKMLQTVLSRSPAKNVQKTKETITDEEILTQLKSVKRQGTKVVLGWLLSLCRNTVAAREANKDCYMTITHKLRLAYRHLAQLMVREERLPHSQLLFFLTHYELGILLQTRDPVLVTKAIRRKRLFPQWEQLVFPELSTGLPVPISIDSAVPTKGAHLKGTSVCGGTVMGRACVVTSLDQIDVLRSGDILITHSTDIGWSPYFPLLAGIVTELGGLISHGAVVAREYGLPCIVGCQNATKVFATGDIVLLVGAMGTLDKIDTVT